MKFQYNKHFAPNNPISSLKHASIKCHDYLFYSAKIMYTFEAFYGILQINTQPKGGAHENLSGSRCTAQGQYIDFGCGCQPQPAHSPGACCFQKNTHGHPGRTYQLDHRTDLQPVWLPNSKILLRYPPGRDAKRHPSAVAKKDRPQKSPQADTGTGKARDPASAHHGQKHVRDHRCLEGGGLFGRVEVGGANIERLWNQQKKTPVKETKERARCLLVPEHIEVLDGALKPKSIEITRQSIQADLDKFLRRGFTTTHAGGFFFIAYLKELGIYQRLSELSAPKSTGIPNEKIALQMIWEPLFGYVKGIRSVDPVSQTDFGILSGLPFICSASTEYRFLAQSSIEKSELFQKHLGKRLVDLDYINGGAVNMDGHSIKLYSRKEMKASYLSKDKTYGKAIRTFYTQDQESKKPLFAKVAYSGATVSQVTPEVVEATKEILGGPFLSVMDKEWFIGSLLNELDKVCGIQVLLPIKRTSKRIKEMETLSLGDFKVRFGKEPVATLFTDLDGFIGKLKLFVKRNDDGSFFGLITNKKYFRASRVMETYSKRWRIENCFNENTFLGIDKLPSLELNAIQTALSLKLVSFHLMDNFRKNLPSPFSSMKPESIFRNFISGVQGKVQLKDNRLKIDIYGFRHRDVVMPLFNALEKKLIDRNIDPRCQWLNDYALEFSFK